MIQIAPTALRPATALRSLSARSLRPALLAAALLATASCNGIQATATVTPAPSAGQSALATGPAPSALTGASRPEWPTYLGSGARNGVSTDTSLTPANAGTLVPRVQVTLGGPIAAQPIVVDGVAYVGAWDGNEYAIDLALGTVRWKTFLGETTTTACDPNTLGVTSSATVDAGVLYVGGGDAYWYALDAATGAVQWKIKVGDNSPKGGLYNWSSPLIWQGSAYIGVASNCDKPLVQGQLLRVDLATHEVMAHFDAVPRGQTGGGIWQTPALDAAAQTIYVTTGNYSQPASQPLAQSIVAVDATTLKVKSSWQTPASQSIADGDWGTTPTLFTDAAGRQLVGAANKNGLFYAFDRSHLDAGPVWMQRIAIGGDCPDCGEGTVSTPAFADGRLYVGGGKAVIAGQDRIGFVQALDPANGSVIWERPFEHAVIPALTWVNGMVVGGIGPDLVVLNAADGSVLLTTHTGPDTYSAPSSAEGMLFVGSLDGTLWGFGLPAAQ